MSPFFHPVFWFLFVFDELKSATLPPYHTTSYPRIPGSPNEPLTMSTQRRHSESPSQNTRPVSLMTSRKASFDSTSPPRLETVTFPVYNLRWEVLKQWLQTTFPDCEIGDENIVRSILPIFRNCLELKYFYLE